MRNFIVASVALSIIVTGARGQDKTVLVEQGQAKAVIYAPPRVWDDAKTPEQAAVWRSHSKDVQRIRLRESIKDFAAILERISGGKIEIVSGDAKVDKNRVAIYVGELAEKRFGKPAKQYPAAQGFRIVVRGKEVGLVGESDLATSYALYTVLDNLGCRWFLPGTLGEVLPATKTIALEQQDATSGPYTVFRGLWYCDNDFARRNRLGGMELSAGHAFEMTVPKELRKSHPEIKAVVNGKSDEHKVKWTHPLVTDAIANVFLQSLKKDPSIPTFSMSPDDGLGWDESYDTKFDTGDFDPSVQAVSKTDRLIYACNKVAEKVAAQHPHVKIGVLAYADYTRPPTREKVHPNVVPEIAPITFSRAHPMTDDGEPNNKVLRDLVEGWAKKSPEVSYYFYAFYLAEPAAPNPHITKWSIDLPIIYKHNCKYWQPETISNFETHMHGNYLGMRLAWNPQQEPAKIFAELHDKFYGAAGPAMAAYWKFMDEQWWKTPEYSGCGFGHLRRFPLEKMQEARRLMDQAVAAAKTQAEKDRVELANASLRLFEQFMKCRRDLAEGRFATLGADAKKYRDALVALCDKYEKNYCFGRMGWTGKDSINGRYFASFYQLTYDDAAKIAKDFQVVTTEPLVKWRFQADKDKVGLKQGFESAKFDDAKWTTTDVCRQTWSSLDLHNYMGSAWYRTRVNVPAAPGKKHRLWIGATDGSVKVYVNGKHVPYHDAKGKAADEFSGYCQPASFDITSALVPGDNVIALYCTRTFLNELGTGGLLAPATIYRDK